MSSANGRVGSLLQLANRVEYLSWTSCAFAVLVSCFSWLELSALREHNPAEPYSWQVDYIDPTLTLIAGAGALLYFVTFVIAGFLSLRWIYRANSNAHSLNASLGMPPRWNVGWFFVPIATWWKPYEGVRDVWRISANPQDPASVERPALLVKWWTFWLLTNITGTASFRLQLRASEVGTAIVANTLDIVSSLALVPATYFFLAVVRDITEKQQRFAAIEAQASCVDI